MKSLRAAIGILRGPDNVTNADFKANEGAETIDERKSVNQVIMKRG